MIQSRIASLVASFSVRVPNSTGRTSAPSSSIRSTFGCWRRMSSEPMYTTQSNPKRAQTVAVATPCWPGARLGDDPLLAEPAREHRLPERVVQLVRAGVEEVLALQVEPLAGREALGERERRRPAGVLAAELVELAAERRVGLRLAPAGLELVECREQRLGT